MLENIVEWVKAKVAERTSWDGALLIAAGVLALMSHPMLDVLAWVAIGWGAYTLWLDE